MTAASISRRGFIGTAGSSLVAATTLAEAAPPVAQREVEVLVCGGGCAGLAAALSAARRGAKTLLLERAGFAGGIITTVGLPFFDGIADIEDNRVVVRGIALELLSKSGVCEPDATHVKTHNPTVHNVEKFKLLGRPAAARRSASGWTCCFTPRSAAWRWRATGSARCWSRTRAGITRVRAQVVIDCTGDADVGAFRRRADRECRRSCSRCRCIFASAT